MVWNKDSIYQKLRQFHRAGKDLSYNAMCRSHQSLVSAAAYHFGSYRRAVERAGINYAEVIRRPRWTRQLIVQLIKQAHRRGDDLNWSAVTNRRDELGRAAFAALQPRLFGSWDAALAAAGLKADQISRYRTWNAKTIVARLRALARARRPLNSGAIQRGDPGLHAAAIRHFKTYDAALKTAGIDPLSVRQRRSWSKSQVIQALKAARRDGRNLSGSAMRGEMPALYGAAIRLFGTFTQARQAAGIQWKRKRRAK